MASVFIPYVVLAVVTLAMILATLFTRLEPGTIALTRRFAVILSISMIVAICMVGYKSIWR